jgi:hypothetical protein
MKANYLTCIFVFLFCAAAFGLDEWSDQAISRISDVSTRPTESDFEYLCLLASSMGSRNETRNKVYSTAVSKLQEMDDIEVEFQSYLQKNKLKLDQQALLPSARRSRVFALKALGKIRHPDAVKVLGSMLSISPEAEQDYYKKMMEHRDYTILPPDAILAAQALYDLVEDPPLQKDPANYLLTDVRPWSGWWDEVKSGERTFSFNGQAKSYRFHADGTWETLPGGSSFGSRSGGVGFGGTRPETRSQREKSGEPLPGRSRRPWVWAAVLLAGAAFAIWRISPGNGRRGG